jgi:hypothetical protein
MHSKSRLLAEDTEALEADALALNCNICERCGQLFSVRFGDVPLCAECEYRATLPPKAD